MNTKYFHRLIISKRMKNAIMGVHIGIVWCEEPEEVKEEIKDMFKNRFN